VGFLIVLLWVAFAALGYAVGNSKGRGTEGLVLGVVLGLIGIIIVACLKPKAQPMPYGYYGHAPAPAPWMQPQPAPMPGALQACGPHWAPDPTGRHQYRWWDGMAWSNNVSDNGVGAMDPLHAG